MAAFIQISEVQTQVGKAGHIAASSKGYVGSSLARVCEANINAGLGVVSGATKGKTIKAPVSDLEVQTLFEGALIDPEFKNDTSAAADYLLGQQVSVLEEGYIWVQVEGTPAVGGLVCCRHTSDGASNTTLGKFRTDSDYPAGGVILTPVAVVGSDSNHYSVTLFDGQVRRTYSFNSDVTPTVAEVITGLVTLINADTPFDAVDNTTTLSVTSVTGVLEVDTGAQFVLTAPTRAALVRGAKFTSVAGTDSGGRTVAQIRLPAK